MDKTVGVRRLRDELTRHLARVRRGGRIIITDRGRPVALLLPYGVDQAADGAERLRRILSSSHVLAAERQFLRKPPLAKGRGPLPSDLIADERR